MLLAVLVNVLLMMVPPGGRGCDRLPGRVPSRPLRGRRTSASPSPSPSTESIAVCPVCRCGCRCLPPAMRQRMQSRCDGLWVYSSDGRVVLTFLVIVIATVMVAVLAVLSCPSTSTSTTIVIVDIVVVESLVASGTTIVCRLCRFYRNNHFAAPVP